MLQTLLQIGLWAVGILVLAYFLYMLGLFFVFRRLGANPWPAFVPAYNYIVLIRVLGLPVSWQAAAFVPYLGQIYSIAVGVRLGKIFGKSVAFSSFWLTIGAPIGMPILALSKHKPDLSVIDEPAPRIDTKKLQKQFQSKGKIKHPNA